MRYIKICLFFLEVLFGIAIIGFFGSLGVYAVKEIFSYLFTHCKELIVHTIMFIFGLVGVVLGWGVFCNFTDKLKDS